MFHLRVRDIHLSGHRQINIHIQGRSADWQQQKDVSGTKSSADAELLFEAWANAGPFVANKQSEDYGIDYVCRELRAVGSSGTMEETTGASVSVQVRSTTSKERPRISLDREDVETALRQEGPYCIVGVSASTRTVHFRLLDLETAASWARFLQTTRASLSIRLDSMSTGMDTFVAELHRVARPAFRAKLALAITLHAIRSEIPESNLELSSGPAGEWALVRTPSLGAIFSPRTPDERESLARTLFSPEPFDDTFREALKRFTVQPSLHRVWDLTDGDVYFAGEAESQAELTVEQGDKHVASVFIVRNVADERAYIGRSGLVIRISRRRPAAGGRWCTRSDSSSGGKPPTIWFQVDRSISCAHSGRGRACSSLLARQYLSRRSGSSKSGRRSRQCRIRTARSAFRSPGSAGGPARPDIHDERGISANDARAACGPISHSRIRART